MDFPPRKEVDRTDSPVTVLGFTIVALPTPVSDGEQQGVDFPAGLNLGLSGKVLLT